MENPGWALLPTQPDGDLETYLHALIAADEHRLAHAEDSSLSESLSQFSTPTRDRRCPEAESATAAVSPDSAGMESPLSQRLFVPEVSVPKRRRLLSKTAVHRGPPSVCHVRQQSVSDDQAASARRSVGGGDEDVAGNVDVHVDGPELVERMSAADRKVYKQFHKSFTRWLKGVSGKDQWLWPNVRPSWEGFKRQIGQMQKVILAEWASCSKCDQTITAWAMQAVERRLFRDAATGDTGLDADLAINAKSVLLTYQGDFGVFDESVADVPSREAANAAFVGSAELAKDLMHGNRHAVTYVEEVVKNVLLKPKFQALQMSFESFVTDLQEKLFATSWSWCLELCIKTLFDTGTVRVHGHAFMHKDKGRIRVRNRAVLGFQEAMPALSLRDQFMRQRSATAAAGLYYTCAAGKYGQIVAGSSMVPHRDFVVQPAWILNLLGMGKMSPTAAREHLVLQCRDLPRLLSSVDKYIHERRMLSLQRHQHDVVAQLNTLTRPFVHIPAVQEWIAEHRRLQWRYKFLILNGASMLGKTRYALGLVPPGRGLELNCIAGNEPDLRGYDPTETDLILFDEMPAAAILGQKKTDAMSSSDDRPRHKCH